MPGIVITGHGGFATGLLQAVEQVVGPQPHCAAVDFPEQMSTAQLNDALRSALAAVAQPDGVVFLTDMLGGSPFRSACELADAQGDCGADRRQYAAGGGNDAGARRVEPG